MARPSSPLLACALLAAVTLYGCGGASSPSPAPSYTTGSPPPPATGTPHEPTRPSAPPSTTDTAWGRIWDGVPRSFPMPPGASPTETGAGPASGEFVVAAQADAVAGGEQASLRGAGYSIEAVSGPFEDGSLVLDVVGPAPQCRVQVTLAPFGQGGDTTLMTVLFGAGCPYS